MQLPLWLIIIVAIVIVIVSLIFGTRRGETPERVNVALPEPASQHEEFRALGGEVMLEQPFLLQNENIAIISMVQISPQGNLVAGCGNKGLYLWDAETGKIVGPSGQAFLSWGATSIYALDFSDDGRWLAADATSGIHGHLQIWDVRDGSRTIEMEVLEKPSNFLAFSPETDVVAWLSSHEVGIWDPSTANLRTIPHDGILALTWIRDENGNLLLATLMGSIIEIIDPVTLQAKTRHEIETDIYPIGFIAGGAYAVFAFNRKVEIWETVTGRLLHRQEGLAEEVTAACSNSQLDLVFLGTNDGHIQIWRPADGAVLADVQAHDQAVYSLACSPSGRLASAAQTDNAKLWDISRMQFPTLYQRHE